MIFLLAFALILPLSAADGDKQVVSATNTDCVKFSPGGLIRLNHADGFVNVEGWDQPDVEITVVKSTRRGYPDEGRKEAEGRLNLVSVATQRVSDKELAVSATFPHRRFFEGQNVTVEYRIRVPRDTRLAIAHESGYVLVTGVNADIEATARTGDIMLMLPEAGTYAIDAKSKLGNVTSDFAGQIHHQKLVGERY